MSWDEQVELTSNVWAIWPDAQLIDRLTYPNQGYRAYHVIPRIEGCYVEIQIRSFYQDTWAQVMEMFGDLWGRGVRYGDDPQDPNAPFGQEESGRTRGQAIELWREKVPTQIAWLEHHENERSRLAKALQGTPETWTAETEEADARLAEMDQELDEKWGVLRELLREARAIFAQQPGTVSP
jgi:hypothetical protein